MYVYVSVHVCARVRIYELEMHTHTHAHTHAHTHTQVGESTSQLLQYFQPQPRQIKKRIEELMMREYIKRDENQSNLYHYLA
jgi:hypothetical protein